MKSSIDSKTEKAFYYAVNFYSTNDRSLEKQRFCLNEMTKYGLDYDSCIRIQNPVMSIIRYGEIVDIANEVIQNQLRIVTDLVRNRLLELQPTLQPEKVSELPHIPTLGGSSSASKKRDVDGVNVQVKNIVQDVTINGYMGQKALVMSNYDLEPHDMNYLSATMPSHSYNFSLVDFSNNPRIGPVGLDYTLKGAPGILSIQSGITDLSSMYQGVLTRSSFNIVKLDLSNCNIGDVGADILGHALVSRKLPATIIDVSGNGITQDGQGLLSKAFKNIQQSIVITLETLQSASKEALQKSINGMLFVAKQNGINPKEVVTTKETAEHCSKGILKVSANILIGLVKCNNPFVKYSQPKDLTLQDVGTDVIAVLAPWSAPGLNTYCNTEKVFFSVVDEDFANCLVGVDSGLND